MILSLINCGKTEIETSGTVSNSLVSLFINVWYNVKKSTVTRILW